MPDRPSPRLRVLVANERAERLARVAAAVEALGYEVIAPQIDVREVGAFTRREQPDVAFVGLGENSAHALDLIEAIVREAACPVIVLLSEPDTAFVREAARRGVFAQITNDHTDSWENSIEIALRRFAQLQDLEGAFRNRAEIERAKGILMERHSMNEIDAAATLRRLVARPHATLVETARAIIDGTLSVGDA